MAIQLNAFPFDSQIIGYGADGLPEYDRASNSLELATLIRSFWRNGVFGTGALTVIAGGGMSVTVSTGSVLVQGRVAHITAEKTLSIDSASANARIDRVVVRCDLSNAVRDLVLDVKKGTPAASPTAPSLTRNESVWEVCLANIRVAAGATSISQSMITDTRLNNNLCGIVAATMTEVDTDRFYAQVQADLEAFRVDEKSTMAAFFANRRTEFDDWFADIKNILDESAASKLTAQLLEKASVASEIVTISPSGWTDANGRYTQRVVCSIAKAEENNVYVVSPVPTSVDEYSDCGIYAMEFGDSYAVFSAKEVTQNTLFANIVQIEKGWSTGASVNSFATPVEDSQSGPMVFTDIAAERPAVELISHIDPVQSGSGEPSPDNVRPIGGRSSVEAVRTRKNILSCKDLPQLPYENRGITFDDAGDGKIRITGTATAAATMDLNSYRVGKRTFIPAGTYTLSGIVSGSGARIYFSGYETQDAPTSSAIIDGSLAVTTTSKVFTFAKSGYYACYISISKGTVIDTIVSPQLEAGSVATPYEHYFGRAFVANLSENVYAGMLNWATGILQQNELDTLTGDEPWQMFEQTGDTGRRQWYYSKAGVKRGSTVVSSHYKSILMDNRWSDGNNLSCYSSNGAVCIRDDRFESLDDWVEYLKARAAAGEPVQLLFDSGDQKQLVLQLPNLLMGVNVIWSTTGDTDLTYVMDTKKYIDRQLAAIAAAAVSK